MYIDALIHDIIVYVNMQLKLSVIVYYPYYFLTYYSE